MAASLPSSSDTTTQTHYLSLLPRGYFHQIEQWQYGASSVKPTTLRTLGRAPLACT